MCSVASYDNNTSYILNQQLNIVDEVQRLAEQRITHTEFERTAHEIEIQEAENRLAQLKASHSSIDRLNEEEYDQVQLEVRW